MAVDNNKEQPQPTPEAKLKKVREWLSKAGYPLEMRVARAFARESHFTRVERNRSGVVLSDRSRRATWSA